MECRTLPRLKNGEAWFRTPVLQQRTELQSTLCNDGTDPSPRDSLEPFLRTDPGMPGHNPILPTTCSEVLLLEK